MSRSRRLMRLILDFDGTLTHKDTLHLVAQAGYDRQSWRQPPRTITPWHDVVDAYMVDYKQHADSYTPAADSRKTLHEEFAWLNSLKQVETASSRRVNEAGVFENVTLDDIEKAAFKALNSNETRLRSGWYELVSYVMSWNNQAGFEIGELESIQVVSVNWSRWFVWSILQNAAQALRPLEQLARLQDIAIYANELPSVGKELESLAAADQVKPRGSAVELRTAGDKAALTIPFRTYSSSSYWDDVMSIYVGDSATDLQCLSGVDVGICMRDEPMGSSQQDLADMCNRLGIQIEHVSECKALGSGTGEDRGRKQENKLWWCRNFEEILAWLKASST